MASTKSGVSTPVTQMLSAKHDNKTIARWLEAFADTVGGPPKEVVIDESAALLLASIKAFTQFNNVPQYLNRCHQLLEICHLNNDKIELPTCFIRHDISHIIKNLVKAKVFEKCQERVKKFFLYAIGSLFAIENFPAVKIIVQDLLILSMSPFESQITQNSIKRLKTLIETHKIEHLFVKNSKTPNDEFEETVSNVLTVEHENSSEIKSSKYPEKKIMNWFEEIKGFALHETINKQNVNTDNVYYFPSFVAFFEKLIYKMPTWSAVMKNILHSPNVNVSSSNCESEFKFIKRYLFKNTKKMRVDKFMFGHINDIIGRLLLATSDLNRFKLLLKKGL